MIDPSTIEEVDRWTLIVSDIEDYQWGTLWRDKGIPLYPHSSCIPSYSNYWYGEYERAWNNSGSAPTLATLLMGLPKTWVITRVHLVKKAHYATKCSELMKNLNTSKD